MYRLVSLLIYIAVDTFDILSLSYIYVYTIQDMKLSTLIKVWLYYMIVGEKFAGYRDKRFV